MSKITMHEKKVKISMHVEVAITITITISYYYYYYYYFTYFLRSELIGVGCALANREEFFKN